MIKKKAFFTHIMYLGTKVKRISHNIFPKGAHSLGWGGRTTLKMLSINATRKLSSKACATLRGE